MGPQAAYLPGGRLHLQHGPIDLVIGAEGARDSAFDAACARFDTLLAELMADYPRLRLPQGPAPASETARRMVRATAGHAGFVTPMAAVAGAVAETVLAAMTGAADLSRAYVNNGGDIALHLTPGQRFDIALATLDARDLGRISIRAGDGIGGIATSGRGGRSLTMGIADSVTVLAATAAEADAAATLIANAVDLPGHPAITRAPADSLRDDSDLGARPVVIACAPLNAADRAQALRNGAALAERLCRRGRIRAAALHLQGDTRLAGDPGPITHIQKELTHA